MSRLSKLLGKPKEVEIQGEKLLFKPLTVKDIDLIMDLESESKRATAMKKIIAKTLKEAVPDATDEEIESVAIENFAQLTDAIMEVNGLKDVPQGKNRQTIPQAFGQESK